MSLLPRWRPFGPARGRAQAAALEEQVTALQTALAQCKTVARRMGRMGRGMTAAIAVLALALGFVLGANRERIAEAMVDLARAVGLASPAQNADAAYAAYQKGGYPRALKLARPLAEQGDARAQSLLGLIYYNGRGVPRDDSEALKWLRLAAGQDDAPAQFQLGLMYSEGRGLPQDYAEAAKWYRLAADRGYAQAQYNLGLLYVTGDGVPQDNVSAYLWFNLAAARFPASDTRNRAAVNNRDVVANKISREQLAEAQKQAREWKAR